MDLVIWVGTPIEIVSEMLRMAQINSNDIVYDLGSGDARILISSVKDFGAKKAVGYEIREDLYWIAERRIKQLQLQNRIEIFKDDLLEADFSEASVITLYLTSEANELLRPKLENSAKVGSRVVSHLFPINGWKAAKTVDLQSLSLAEDRFIGMLYLYHVPEAFK